MNNNNKSTFKKLNFQNLNRNDKYIDKLFTYDINEYSKRHIKQIREDKVNRQQTLISSVSSKLIYFKNNDKDKLIDSMINSKSTFDKVNKDNRLEIFTIKNSSLKRSSSMLFDNRKKINDYYAMNDKFIKQRDTFLQQTDSKPNWKRPPNFLDLFINKRNTPKENSHICKRVYSCYNNQQ